MKRCLHFILLFTFLLGCHKGYVALWTEGSDTPVEIYPYRVNSLPPADQAALEKGIPIKNDLELSSLLEDYLS